MTASSLFLPPGPRPRMSVDGRVPRLTLFAQIGGWQIRRSPRRSTLGLDREGEQPATFGRMPARDLSKAVTGLRGRADTSPRPGVNAGIFEAVVQASTTATEGKYSRGDCYPLAPNRRNRPVAAFQNDRELTFVLVIAAKCRPTRTPHYLW
jgi:hypothetical protein